MSIGIINDPIPAIVTYKGQTSDTIEVIVDNKKRYILANLSEEFKRTKEDAVKYIRINEDDTEVTYDTYKKLLEENSAKILYRNNIYTKVGDRYNKLIYSISTADCIYTIEIEKDREDNRHPFHYSETALFGEKPARGLFYDKDHLIASPAYWYLTSELNEKQEGIPGEKDETAYFGYTSIISGPYELSKSEKPYTYLKKEEEYLYTICYADTDDEFANKYFRGEHEMPIFGGCSAFIKGNKLYRYYDWKYNYSNEFEIYTPARPGKYAVRGTANYSKGNYGPGINESKQDIKDFTETDFKILPYFIVDGSNEHRLILETNVVPIETNEAYITDPAVEKQAEVCQLALGRYLLEHCKTVDEVKDCVNNYVAVYDYKPLSAIHYDLHYLIHDVTGKAVILEFVAGEPVFIDIDDNTWPIMTNFFISGVVFNSDHKVYTPKDHAETGHSPLENHITLHGSGLERYNIIVDILNDPSDAVDISKLFYTNAYTDTENTWYTEFVSGEEYTVDTLPEKFEQPLPHVRNSYQQHLAAGDIRDFGQFWHTTHAVIYDLATGESELLVQEKNPADEKNWHYFKDFYYTANQIDNKFEEVTTFANEIAEDLATHIADNEAHLVSDEQRNAVNSGITAEKVRSTEQKLLETEERLHAALEEIARLKQEKIDKTAVNPLKIGFVYSSGKSDTYDIAKLVKDLAHSDT